MTGSDKSRPDNPPPPVGGVRHDARGHAVWQWATDTARHAVASTSQLLRRLDVSSLKLEQLEDEKPRTKVAAPVKPAPPAGKRHAGFNPYDGAAIAGAPLARNPTAMKKSSAAPARERPPWWRRLFRRR